MAYTVNKAQTTNNDKRTGSHIYPGTFLAEVMHNQDPQKAGRLWVFISEFGYDKNDPASWVVVSYASPFYGISPHTAPTPPATGGQSAFTSNNPTDRAATGNTSPQQQQEQPVTTYGFWAIPPDVGVKVLCTFVEGNSTYGYWYAIVPTISHSMIPAMGAPDGKSPVMDINPLSPKIPTTEDLDSLERQPYEPLMQQFSTQGINEDPLRGPITSSSFRESPSRVFGISSQNTPEAPGHSFVMDDGDAEGKNKLIRLRTANGSQITMHDDTGMIYFINASGTGWVEISPSGHIDVFGAAGINLATPESINIHATKNVNIHAGENLKLIGMKGTKLMGGEELQLHGKKTMIEGVDSLHVHSCKEMMFTSFADIHMKAFNYFCLKGKCFYWNSCTAKEAEQVPPEEPKDLSGYQTTVERAPNKEPYKEHDGGAPAGGGAAAGGAGGMDSASSSLGGGFTLPSNISMGPAMDTAATSLGNGFSLPFKTNLPGNSVGGGSGSNNWGSGAGQTQPRDASPAKTSVSSSGMSFTSSPLISNANGTYTTVDYSYNQTKPAATQSTNSLANAARTTSNNTITTYNYRPPTTVQVGPNGTDVTTPASLTATTSANSGPNRGLADSDTTQTLTQQNAVQSQDAFTSNNPADQAMTGRSPAQEAGGALEEIGDMVAGSDLPAATGGGAASGFAKGDNCERPADETGGSGLNPSGQGDQGLPTDAPEGSVSQKQLYDEWIARGKTPEEARLLSAVGMAESNGKLGAYNGKGLDDSYGVMQVNMKGALGTQRLAEYGLTSKTQLWDLKTNLDAADRIYKTQGIRAWGAYTNGSYKKYY